MTEIYEVVFAWSKQLYRFLNHNVVFFYGKAHFVMTDKDN